jgi:hypothetical protein
MPCHPDVPVPIPRPMSCDPHGAGPRPRHPASTNPHPRSVIPPPIPRHPYIRWPGRNRNHFDTRRRRSNCCLNDCPGCDRRLRRRRWCYRGLPRDNWSSWDGLLVRHRRRRWKRSARGRIIGLVVHIRRLRTVLRRHRINRHIRRRYLPFRATRRQKRENPADPQNHHYLCRFHKFIQILNRCSFDV